RRAGHPRRGRLAHMAALNPSSRGNCGSRITPRRRSARPRVEPFASQQLEEMKMSPNPAPPGRRLPDLSLPAAPGGATTSLRPRGREGALVIATHGAECQPCRAYLRGLVANHEAIEEWDGRVVVLHPGTLAE